MAQSLPTPDVTRCYFDGSFDPPLPAMSLAWSGTQPERIWELPEGMSVVGPAPERFGVSIRRLSRDSYTVRLLWDHTRLSWESLSRVQLLTSALSPLLAALDTDLRHLLDQPIQAPPRALSRAA
jgi:hypothetical protein